MGLAEPQAFAQFRRLPPIADMDMVLAKHSNQPIIDVRDHLVQDTQGRILFGLPQFRQRQLTRMDLCVALLTEANQVLRAVGATLVPGRNMMVAVDAAAAAGAHAMLLSADEFFCRLEVPLGL